MRSRATFAGLTIGNFLVLLDASILNVALPDVQRTLRAGDAALPWAAVAYTVVFAGLLLAAGAVADRVGARRLYTWSLLGFAICSLGCAAAPSIEALIGVRALLGACAACVVPSSLALLSALHPEPAERARAVGAWAALVSVGLLLGPILGGVLVAAGGWRLVFVINPPIVLAAVLLVRHLDHAKPARPRPLDRAGVALSTIALGALSLGCIEGGMNGWTQPLPIAALAAAVIAAVALGVQQRRSRHPVLPSGLLANRTTGSAILAASAASLVFYGVLYALTLWFQRTGDLDPLETGLAFVPMTLPMCVLPMVTGRLVGRLGPAPIVAVGLAGNVAAGLLLLLPGSSDPGRGWILAAQLAIVLACTTVIPAATAAVAIAAPAEYAASAQGALNAARQAGSAIGVAILAPLGAITDIGAVLTVIALAALVATGLGWTRGGARLRRRRRDQPGPVAERAVAESSHAA